MHANVDMLPSIINEKFFDIWPSLFSIIFVRIWNELFKLFTLLGKKIKKPEKMRRVSSRLKRSNTRAHLRQRFEMEYHAAKRQLFVVLTEF